MVDFQPDARHVDLLDNLARNRGWIVGCFAQIEFILAHFVIKCRRFPEYEALTTRFPYRWESRIERVRAILHTDGPLSRKRNQFAFIELLDAWTARRNLMVHGWAEMAVTPEYEAQFSMRLWSPTAGKDDQTLNTVLSRAISEHER